MNNNAKKDFVETGDVENEMNEQEARNCYLVGLTDLYGANTAVQSAISGYLNQLVDLGVAGVRIDAAKYMWPEVKIFFREHFNFMR